MYAGVSDGCDFRYQAVGAWGGEVVRRLRQVRAVLQRYLRLQYLHCCMSFYAAGRRRAIVSEVAEASSAEKDRRRRHLGFTALASERVFEAEVYPGGGELFLCGVLPQAIAQNSKVHIVERLILIDAGEYDLLASRFGIAVSL